MKQSPWKLILIMVVAAISIYVALPDSLTLPNGQTIAKRNPVIPGTSHPISPPLKLGLDIQGGTEVVMEASMAAVPVESRQEALDAVREVIARRVDLFGLSETVVRDSYDPRRDSYRVVVELPGVSDVDQVLSLVGQTAQLDFRAQNPLSPPLEASASIIEVLEQFIPTGLEGKDLARSYLQFDPNTGEPVVSLEFTEAGSTAFSEITKNNIGKPVGIFLDGWPLTLPVVNNQILDGKAIISGTFTVDEAKQLAVQLQAGALPAPVSILSLRSVGPSLGSDVVASTLIAGVIGLVLVSMFMVIHYGRLGVIATTTLVLYGAIMVALSKILGITITLPGLAGVLLSVGMAVDANILIYARYFQERRIGRNPIQAMELAFGKAWDAIKDANVATLSICFLLFNPLNWTFLNTSGPIRGFAASLALGVLISLFTGVLVTRTFIRHFYRHR